MEHSTCLRIDVVAALEPELLAHQGVALEPVMMIRISFLQIRQLVLQRATFFLHAEDFLEDRKRFLKDRSALGIKTILREIAETQVFSAADGPLVSRAQAGQHS
jgi:hypothetical protein